MNPNGQSETHQSGKDILRLYQPHPGQVRFHASTARFKIAACGRQFGKSTMCNQELISKAWAKPGSHYWFISPIYSQAKDQYRRLTSFLSPEVIAKKSETELRIELIQGSVIEYKSGESFDNLRGASLNGVIIDEVRDQDPELWPRVVRPMLTTTAGWANFVSTPNGFDSFYDLFDRAKKTEGWEAFTAPSTESPFISSNEIEQARQEMSEAEFAQEILAEFRDLHTGKVYKSAGEWNYRTDNPFAIYGEPISPYLPVVVGLDFNVGHMRWTLGQHRNGDWYWFDEVAVNNTNTQECAPELVHKLLPLIDNKYLRAKPHVILCGDATGNSRSTKATETDYMIIKQALDAASITWQDETPESNPAVKDRVNTLNSKLKAADGSIHCWINPITCPNVKRDLERVSWKAGAQLILDQVKDPSLTHASDSIGYPIHQLSPLIGSGQVGTLKLIRR